MDNFNETKKIYQKRNFYTIKDSGFIYLCALLLPLAASLIFAIISMFIAQSNGVEFPEDGNATEILCNTYLWYVLIYAVLTQVVFVCIYFTYHKTMNISYKATSISFKKANVWTVLLSIFVGIVCVLGFVWLIEGCFGQLFTNLGLVNEEGSTTYYLPNDNVGWLFVNLLLLGVIPAICEEFIFRGVIYKGLRQKYSATSSILLCGLIFALMHGSITQFIYPFILGCLLSFVMEKTNNLLYTILIHLFNNFTTVFISFLDNIGAISLSFNVSWWGIICAILIAAATVAILWLIYRFYLKKQPKIEEEKTGEVQQDEPVMVGKMPLTIVCGIVLSIIFIIINMINLF